MEKLTFKKAFMIPPGPTHFLEYFLLYLKGFLMGTVDLVPGVSGGTIAIITGIYEKLLNAIASLNKESIQFLLKWDFAKFLSTIHLRFLVILLFGMGTAIFSLARLMHFLITEHTVYTYSLFVGLVLASVFVIYRGIPFKYIGLLLLGTFFAYFFVGMIPAQTPESYLFLFLCGAVAISAMILPGLSGSFVLLILGKYEFVMAAVKNPFNLDNIFIIVIFGLGVVTGACIFTRILKWFFTNYKNATIALLSGILLGSLRKIWPWREVLESQIIAGKEKIIRELNYIPIFNQEVVWAIIIASLGFIVVVTLNHKASKNN